ncbi:MAG: hypothetical protein ACJ8C3_25630 [Microvirga sp.]|jgi:hypothetical protein
MSIRKRQAIAWCLAFAATAASAHAQPSDVGFVEGRLSTVAWGQYMAQQCEPTTVSGWEGFPTVLCRYPSAHGTVPVAMMNAGPGRLARWLVAACQDAGAQFPKHCAERLAVRIKCQSGNQFPVAGFVDEGPLYTFRDGVTVTFASIGTSSLQHAPSQAQIDSVLGAGAIAKVHSYARVQGTTREEYAAFVQRPVASFAGLNWRAEVRAAYQAAWSSDRNALLSAWARANRSLIDHKLAPAARFDAYCKSVAASWASWAIAGE